MSEQRDELAREIFIADNHKIPTIAAQEWARNERQDRPEYVYGIADGLLAAGYSKPRTITTVEDIHTMPVGSIIRMADTKAPFLKTIEGWESTRIPGKPVHDYAHSSAHLPATVLYEPTP